MLKTLALASLTGLLLVTPTPPACQIQAGVFGGPNNLGQYQMRLTFPPTCAATSGLLYARLIAKNGGVIPPIGQFRLSAGYPREVRYWVWPGAHAEQKLAGLWRDLPIRNLPRGWFE
ncbi:hypothetical protein Dcar01_02409 [Deinococcus carri]|uniref:Uncharacterized protein n=1 Tax=Deinococcus carri TaxID=1211323 RepID=A0ABP9WB23_9DEIO